jgi:tetratricopeptide (TPR) repeat protein
MPDNPRIEELRRRVQADPASIAFAALAEEYRRAGRHQEAIETCRTGLQRHPSYLSARVTLGRALIELGNYDAAREELSYVLRAAPENLAAIRGLAEIHHRRGQLPEALEQYKSALQIARHDPELEDTVSRLARDVAPGAPAAGAPAASATVAHASVADWILPPSPPAAPKDPVSPIEVSRASAPTPDEAVGRLEAFLAAIRHARDVSAG